MFDQQYLNRTFDPITKCINHSCALFRCTVVHYHLFYSCHKISVQSSKLSGTLQRMKLTSTILKFHLVLLVIIVIIIHKVCQSFGVRQVCLHIFWVEGNFRFF